MIAPAKLSFRANRAHIRARVLDSRQTVGRPLRSERARPCREVHPAMKIRAALVVPAVIAVLVAGCKQPPMADYTSEDGKFKARFPGQPDVTTTGAGGMVLKMYTVESWSKVYMVGWADAPIPEWESESRTKSRLFDARDGALAAVNGKSNGTTKTILLGDKYPGIEFGGTADNKHVRARAYIVGRRLYQLLVAAKAEEHLTGPEAEDFFNSFALIDPAPPVPTTGPAGASPDPAGKPAKSTAVVINSTSGRFRARYPIDPKKVTRNVGDAAFTAYTAETANGTCEVAFGEVPGPSGAKLSDRLDAARDAAVKAAGGALGKSKSVALGWEHPGREFTAAVADGKHLRGRVFATGTRVYQVTVTGTDEYTDSKDATDFLDSFQLTK